MDKPIDQKKLNEPVNGVRVAISRLEKDTDSLERIADSFRFTIFEVLKMSRMEIRHSNMLAWLLDPNESHGFNSKFLEGILRYCGAGDLFDGNNASWESFRVYRELNHMDIFLVSHELRLTLTIENKIFAGEGERQLERYSDWVEKTYTDYRNVFIFLTPDGRLPRDEAQREKWIAVSYRRVYEVLCPLYDEFFFQRRVRSDQEVLVNHFIKTLERTVMKEIDPNLIQRCRSFYQKHKQALDFIFENAKSGVADIVRDELRAMAKLPEYLDKGLVLLPPEQNHPAPCFHIKKLDDFLGELTDNVGSWGTKQVYYCFLSIDEERQRMCCIFELGGVMCTKRIVHRMRQIDELPPTFREGLSSQDATKLIKEDKGHGGIRYHRVAWYSKKNVNWKSYNTNEDLGTCVQHVVDEFLQWASSIEFFADGTINKPPYYRAWNSQK